MASQASLGMASIGNVGNGSLSRQQTGVTTVAKAKADPATGENKTVLVIQPPKFETVEFTIVGNAPYVQSRFSAKAIEMMKAKHEAGPQAKKIIKKEARDFQADYENAKHISRDGWVGIPASSFRNAMISACRIVGFKMTLAKLGVFVHQDGFDKVDGMPLIKIEGEPRLHQMHARNDSGVCDIRVRPMWEEWSAKPRIRFDAEMFTAADVANLLRRVGMQVGIGEGRPDSRESAGLGWGTFDVL